MASHLIINCLIIDNYFYINSMKVKVMQPTMKSLFLKAAKLRGILY